jgi:hypothetical protein
MQGLRRDELAYRLVCWTVLEPHHKAHLKRRGQLLQGPDRGAVLAALDPRDRRIARAHPTGELPLSETEVETMTDHDPRELLS